jgi:hypothetical protein
MKIIRTFLDGILLIVGALLVVSFAVSAYSGEVAQIINEWVPILRDSSLNPLYLQGFAVIFVGVGIFSSLVRNTATTPQWVE